MNLFLFCLESVRLILFNALQICSLLRGGIAERGGVRVGHRIIEINNQSVVAVPHEKIVNLLATSVGDVSQKICQLNLFSHIILVNFFLV